ncbi:MAG: hypothetical protein HUJ65_02555 [Oscillospiraceae bacterium]|nr:hypothetical protein [Oscillospiraceae bacterium]
MTISEKVAYIKGLIEGLGIDDDKNGKVLKAIVDVLEDMAFEINDLNEFTEELNDGLDEISDDLADVEDFVFGEDDDDCDCCDDDCDCCGDDDDYEFEVTCPSCGEDIVLFDSDLDLDSIECPNCGETLEFVFDEDDEADEEGDEE